MYMSIMLSIYHKQLGYQLYVCALKGLGHAILGNFVQFCQL